MTRIGTPFSPRTAFSASRVECAIDRLRASRSERSIDHSTQSAAHARKQSAMQRLFHSLVVVSVCLCICTCAATTEPFFVCSHDATLQAHPPLSALSQLNATFATPSRSLSAPSLGLSGKRKLKFSVQYTFDEACAHEGQQAPTYGSAGSTTTCRVNDILTPHKRALLDAALQTSLSFLSSALYTEPTSSIDVAENVCPGLPSDALHVADMDFVLFVTASPQMQSGGLVLAWGRACASASTGLTTRPVVGHINFVPSGLGTSTPMLEASLAAHEITHALGFTSLYTTLRSYVDESGVWQTSGGTASVYRPGLRKKVQLVKTPRVLKAARKHFACDSLDGVEIEDMGGGGTAGSHWKKRILFQEALVGVVTSVKLFYTSITLAFFEDAGFYAVDYSMAQDELAWGYGRGCPFLYSDCKTLSEAYGWTEFCFDRDKTGVEKCTFDQLAIGRCEVVTYKSPLPTAHQYFPDTPTQGGAQATMDYCPFRSVYANGNCLDARWQDDRRDAVQNVYGNVFSPSSRCFESSLISSAFPVLGTGARCLPATCTNNSPTNSSGASPRLVLRIQDQTVWCPPNGSAGRADVDSLFGIHGQITCPDAHGPCRAGAYSGVSAQLAASSEPTSSTTTSTRQLRLLYPYDPADDCEARRQRCVENGAAGSSTSLMSLLPRCALFAERALDCFGRRCHGTFQQWLASHVADTASPQQCRTSMHEVADHCIDGWRGATTLCRLFTDAACPSSARHLAVAVILLTLLFTS